ncbi:rCG32831 [Rattus norvegicus]|uniref:RCG32831 n=1 Tax=Rattus norvegicus TaxID=10116 RepID=A6HDS2_RAT|nr:rCG32831 [Rattus norvegicus]
MPYRKSSLEMAHCLLSCNGTSLVRHGHKDFVPGLLLVTDALSQICHCHTPHLFIFFFGSFFRSWGPNPGPCAS